MSSPVLKRFSVRQDNINTDSLCGWEEVGTGDGGGKMMQDRMTDADAAKVTAKKEANICQMKTGKRLTGKKSWKNHSLL